LHQPHHSYGPKQNPHKEIYYSVDLPIECPQSGFPAMVLVEHTLNIEEDIRELEDEEDGTIPEIKRQLILLTFYQCLPVEGGSSDFL